MKEIQSSCNAEDRTKWTVLTPHKTKNAKSISIFVKAWHWVGALGAPFQQLASEFNEYAYRWVLSLSVLTGSASSLSLLRVTELWCRGFRQKKVQIKCDYSESYTVIPLLNALHQVRKCFNIRTESKAQLQYTFQSLPIKCHRHKSNLTSKDVILY